MKKPILFSLTICCCLTLAKAQNNYLDTYIGATITPTIIATASDSLNQPRDLDFKPNSSELWICNYGTANGGNMVIFYNAGSLSQTSQYRKDTHTSHFMRFPSAFAFGDDGKLACVSEIQNTNSGSPTFMGPALWLSDTNIYARVFQNDWVSGLPLGSHVDMLHQSPFAMGIAHDTAMAYWVMDGYYGNICKYDFVNDHGPGYDDHSAGKIWRYVDALVSRVPQVPSHMVLDKTSHWLYFIDGGNKKIKRMNTLSGSVTGNLTVSSGAQEPLAGYYKVQGETIETLDSLATQPCGIDYYSGRLIVSDYTNGNIYLYNTTGVVSIMDTIVTGHPGMMGVKVGPDGHIWCVNKDENILYRLDVAAPLLDAGISKITSPAVENYLNDFYSPKLNVCNGNISPSVDISNTGTTAITTMEIHYMIDGGVHTVYNWTGSLTAGTTTSVSLPVSTVPNGIHRLDVTIQLVNGTADDVDLNNMMTGAFRVINPPQTIPLTEGFESATFPPAGWNYVHFNKNNFMSRASVGGFGGSTGSMKMNNYTGTMDITGQKDYLVSPILDMTSATTAAQLKFTVAHARYNSSTNDEFQVLASLDCGTTWSVIYDKTGATLATTANTTTDFTPSSSQWRTDSVSLSGFAGQSELILSFTAVSNFGNNVYLDDITFSDLPTNVVKPAENNIFAVFPNPSTGILNISYAGNLLPGVTINIYSNDGRLVKSTPVTQSGNLQLNLSGLAKGMYAVQLTDGKNTSVKSIILQ